MITHLFICKFKKNVSCEKRGEEGRPLFSLRCYRYMLVLPHFFFTIFRPLVRINAVAQGHESSVHGGTIQRLEKDDSSRYVESYRGRGLQLIIIFTI